MKNFGISLLTSFLVVLVYTLFFAPRKSEPTPPPMQQISTEHIIVTLMQQNSAPNYQLVFDTVATIGDPTSEAPAGWKIISVGYSGDIVNIEQ